MADLLRVVIAEDNYLLREGTRSLLEDSGEVDVVAAVVDAKGGEAVRGRRARQAESSVAMLSPRELEVLAKMAEGCTNPAIGRALFMSESTVEKHVSAILSKLGLSEEKEIDRRVAAVLTYLREADSIN